MDREKLINSLKSYGITATTTFKKKYKTFQHFFLILCKILNVENEKNSSYQELQSSQFIHWHMDRKFI